MKEEENWAPWNQGLPWTTGDTESLVQRYRERAWSVYALAHHYGRSELAIRCRLGKFAFTPPREETMVAQLYKDCKQHLVEPSTITEEKQMAFELKFETHTFINGNRADELSNDSLLGLIQKAEVELKNIDAIEHKPKMLVARKEELIKGIMNVVSLLDSRG